MGRPLGRALGVSLALHAAVAAVIMAVLAVRLERVSTATPPPRLNLVYVARSAPASTPIHGGGGHRAAAAPVPTTVPAHQPAASITAAAVPAVEPPPALAAPVHTDLATLIQATGSVSLVMPGPGGRGKGASGLGDGDGPGLGPGDGGLTGGGQAKDGDLGVTSPELIHQVRPGYSNDSMRQRIQGTVVLDAVVLANGTVGRVAVVRSLHPELDQQAIAAARKWLFRPGRRNGQPVDVVVSLVIDFRLH
jgi:protein TonB